MKKLKTILHNPLLILFLSGVFLNIPFFFPNIIVEIAAFFVIAPAFYALNKVEDKDRYMAGLLFFGAWMVPTSYWYFNFMSWWLAILAILYFTFIAHVFHVFSLIRKKGLFFDFAVIIISWVGLTFIRINLPITEDWWIPHLAYTQWQNVFVLQVAYLLGIYGVILLILLSNATLAYLWIKKKKLVVVIMMVLVVAVMFIGNNKIINSSKNENLAVSLIAIQSSPEGGYFSDANTNDVEHLKQMTIESLSEIKERDSKDIFVVWPENMIPEINTEIIEKFAKKENIYLTFNRAQKTESDPLNTVVMLGRQGEELLINYKVHNAPGEKISTVENIHHNAEIQGLKITSDICYDLHYSDLKHRINDDDLLFAPVDDDRFGKFMPYLHARDVIYRAIENRVNIITSATSGPTMFVNRFGVIEKGILDIYDEGYLIIEK